MTQTKQRLTPLLSRPDIWQASSLRRESQGIDTGFSVLNKALHQGGWPKGGLTEIMPDRMGAAELMLLIPSLAALSEKSGWLVLIAPPYLPYAPAWAQHGIDLSRVMIVRPRNTADLLWCTEQALNANSNSLISWLADSNIRYRDLRKLQVASQHSAGLSALIRPARCAEQNSPAHLRLKLNTPTSHLELNILKQQGGWAGQQVNLPISQRFIQQQINPEQLPVYRPRSCSETASPERAFSELPSSELPSSELPPFKITTKATATPGPFAIKPIRHSEATN